MPRTVLITGCSSGFGRLIARTFLDAGWNVVATMRSPEMETELKSNDRLLLAQLDVTDSDSIQRAFTKAREVFGQVDVVINNAGYGGSGLFEQFSPDDIHAMYETNVFGPMNVMREALPDMRAAGSGVIVNVTSMAGHLGLPGNSVYSSSKHALVGLTEAMAQEYAPLGVRIFNVAPGAYPTTGFDAAVDKRLNSGDAQLVAFSHKLRAQISAVGAQMANKGGALADPQEVADHVFACVTEDRPIHNPSGSDAEMLTEMAGQANRQGFIDQLSAMLVPAA
ncbi:SDR family oxidoreductase [Roseibium sp. RKSG952]|uniref:SDR family oxidoreductase n=1 Tax=Roseibium sp. RKSG952 TaxID=2529384 RepID=UPI0012BBF14B|nr:SDR family oxidoreductase [Roseibium sp. RKSG952]MTI02168.1 SDR family oxidoreductase [Roseibium sp. RKSG952]